MMKKRLDQLSDAELESLIARKGGAAPMQKMNSEPLQQQISTAGAFGRGALDTASLGFAPKIVGALGAPVVKALRPDLFGNQSYGEAYKELRDTTRNQQSLASEQHPTANFAGSLLGVAGLPFPASTIKGAAKLGAAYGGAQAIGSNDSGEVGQFTADDALGGLAGAGIGGLFGGAAQGLLNKLLPKRAPANPDALERLNISQESGVPITKGEATGNPAELLKEEAAIKGRLGANNHQSMKELKELQNQRFKEYASNTRSKLGGGQAYSSKGAATSDVVNQIQKQALNDRAEYSKLYQEAKKNVAKVSTEDLKQFPKLASDDLESAALTIDNAPKTYGELRALNRILEKPELHLNDLEAWKQGLNRSLRDVQRGGQEEFALKQLSQKFDGYLDGIIEKALVEGDTKALGQFKEARKLAAAWHSNYGAKDPSEFGKKFIEDIVDNARFSREPYSDEMLVNKIFGASELGFKPESAAIVQELKRQGGDQAFSKIKLEAANKLVAPLFAETPNVTTYRNNLKRFMENNSSLAEALFDKTELQDLSKLSTLGDAIFSRPKSLINPSGTAEVILDHLGKKSFVGNMISNLANKRIPLEQEAIKKAVVAGEKMPRQMSAAQKAAVLGTQGSIIGGLAESNKAFDSLSDAQLEQLIASKKEKATTVPTEIEKPKNDLLNKIAYVESGNNPNARSNTSSASGLLQFTDGTWRDAVKRYGQETGISLRDKNDPKAQRVMAQLMLRDNGQELQTFLGRKPNDTELYLTHFLGLGGAKKLLRSRGSEQPAARLLPAAAKANRSIFFQGRRPRTVDEVYQVISQKI